MKRLIFLLSVTFVVPVSAADLPGKLVYEKTKCDTCHGKTGHGNPQMAKVFKLEPAKLDLTSASTAAKKDDQLIQAIAKGQGKMPAYGEKLKPEDINALVAYIRSLKEAKPQ